MKLKAIITGATGMVGKGLLLECLKDPEVESVLVINRQPVGIQHAKLREVIHKDFFDLSPVEQELKGYNTGFFCLGVSSVGMSEAEFHRLTYDLTIHVAETALRMNPEMAICYVSGTGTDSTEKGRMMWARVKGKTENKLLSMPFRDAYMIRLGFLQPLDGIRSKVGWYSAVYRITAFLFPLLRLVFPRQMLTTRSLGQAMIKVVKQGCELKVLGNSDLNGILKSAPVS